MRLSSGSRIRAPGFWASRRCGVSHQSSGKAAAGSAPVTQWREYLGHSYACSPSPFANLLSPSYDSAGINEQRSFETVPGYPTGPPDELVIVHRDAEPLVGTQVRCRGAGCPAGSDGFPPPEPPATARAGVSTGARVDDAERPRLTPGRWTCSKTPPWRSRTSSSSAINSASRRSRATPTTLISSVVTPVDRTVTPR